MFWPDFLSDILARHTGKPQTQRRLEIAVAEVRKGLEAMAAAGEIWHLEAGAGSIPEHWPRIMFHALSAPAGKLVRSEFELADLGEGWYDTLAEARNFEGIQLQNAGRGGIPRRGLPAIGRPKSLEVLAAEAQAAEAAKAAKIAEFKAAHKGKRSQNA
jgi:hypothetical protein